MLIDGSVEPVEVEADVVIVGSGAAGATCARWLAAAGKRVVVVEEGAPAVPGADTRDALTRLYRDGGAGFVLGTDPMPVLQGRCVGGTTVVNGGIQVPFPRNVWEEWDEPMRRLLPWDRLEEAREAMDRELGIAPTPAHLWGGTGEAMRRALPGSSPIRRNTPDCRASGRCLLGCPHGAKASADVALLPRAMADGARVFARCTVDRVRIRRDRPEAVLGRFEGGARFVARAPLVILAASAVQTPRLLARSGVRGTGRGFMCHPGASMAGLFPAPLGPGGTQAMEDLSFRHRGFKLETLAIAGPLMGARVPGFGAVLAERLEQLDRVALWGVACRSEARGRIWPGPTIQWSPTRRDRQVLLDGLSVAAEAMLVADAVEVWPSVHGAPASIRTVEDARRLRDLDPVPGVIPLVATHLFGGVSVRERFQVAGVDGLVVADSSLFPSNIGVNPMSAITAVATLVAEAWD